MYCSNCGASIAENAAFCSGCGIRVDGFQTTNQQANIQQQQPVQGVQFSMNWYKFIIYFALFASAVINVFNAITIFTGSIYGTVGVSAKRIYSYFPNLRGVDMFYGVVLLGIGALAIITRQNLAHYKALGIKLLLSVYIANILLSIIYVIATTNIVRQSTMTSNFGGQLVVSILMVVLNFVYFNKRKGLFH